MPIDSLHFLSRCGVGNGDTEERGGKRIMNKVEKFSFAKVTCELTVCQFSTALPLNLPSTNWHTVQDETKKSIWFLLCPFWTLPAGLCFQWFHIKCFTTRYSEIVVKFGYTAPTWILAINMELFNLYTVKEILQCNYFPHTHFASVFCLHAAKVNWQFIFKIMAEHWWPCKRKWSLAKTQGKTLLCLHISQK